MVKPNERRIPGVWGLAPGYDTDFVARALAKAHDALDAVVARSERSADTGSGLRRVPADAWGTPYAPYGVTGDGVVSVPVEGVLLSRLPIVVPGMATGYEYLKEVVSRASSDEQVRVLRFEISSPGGEASQAHAVAGAIKEARASGLTVQAHARDMAASAAYIAFATADSFTAEPTAAIGSLGVLSEMTSVHRALDRAGIDVAVISAGALKEANSKASPLLPEAVQSQQALVDDMYDQFVALVAGARGVSEERIRGEWGARAFLAPEAKRLGLIDDVVPAPVLVYGLRASDTAGKTAGEQAKTEGETMAKNDSAVQVKVAEEGAMIDAAKMESALRAEGARQVLDTLASLQESAGEELPPAFAAGLDVLLAGGDSAAVAAAVAAVTKAVERVEARAARPGEHAGATALERAMAKADSPVEGAEGEPGSDEPVPLVEQLKALRGL